MSRTQVIPPTNPGTADNYSKDREKAKGIFNEVEKFNDDVIIALQVAQQVGDKLPLVETTRGVIEHFNRGNIAGFDSTGYFMHKGVVVCEDGKADTIKASMLLSNSTDPHDLTKKLAAK